MREDDYRSKNPTSITEMTNVADLFAMTLSLLLLENAHSSVGLDEYVDEDVLNRIERPQNRGLAR
jgi:hypothetical protein